MDTDQVFDVIVRCTREVLPDLEGHEFRRDERLVDLGANSIDRAEIVVLVLEALSLRVPRTEVFGPKNIGDLADILLAKMDSLPAD